MPLGQPASRQNTAVCSHRLLAVALLTLVSLFLAPLTLSESPAAAQDGDDPEGEVREVRPEELTLEQLAEVDIGQLIPDPELSAGVDQVDATSPEYDAAIEAYLNQLALVAEARESLESAKEFLVRLGPEKQRIRSRLATRRLDRRVLVRELDRIENHLRALAVNEYVSSGTTSAQNDIVGLDTTTLSETGQSAQFIEEVGEVQVENRAIMEQSLSRLDADQLQDETRLAEIALSVTTTQNSIEDWSIALFESSTKIPKLEAAVRDHRRLAVVPELGYAVVVLDAYNNAAILSEEIHPGCGVQWWMLSGIGRVETRHGTFNRLPDPSTVAADGSVLPQIIGIPLNGDSNTAVITDTDGGALDRDPIFDRAVGPMQFIPSTWAGNGLDGDGDGIADPHNLYDAALSAAHYLCRTAGNVTTSEGLRRGYFAYNHHDSYVNAVYRHALTYREFEL